MDLKLVDQRALVTGSTGGIGKAIAAALAREGARVVVNGRTPAAVEAAITGLKAEVPMGNFEALATDNGTAEGTEETIRRIGTVDILVNNLGVYEAVGFLEETDAAWQRMFEINIMSGVRLARHYLPGMLKRKTGRIVFISSESAISPAPEMAHYSATKTMQLSISRSLAELTRGTAVTVNTVLPGSTLTEGVARFVGDLFPNLSLADASREFVRQNRPTSLLERLIDPGEVASLVAFVASPVASAINGAALRVDGGLVRSII